MLLRSKILFLLVFSLLSLAGKASTEGCAITIAVQNEKQAYAIGDTIVVLVKVTLEKEFCDEARDITKVFSKGLKIVERSEWRRISEKIVGQKLVVTVLNKGSEKKLTVYRKTAHYNCFEQKEFNIKD